MTGYNSYTENQHTILLNLKFFQKFSNIRLHFPKRLLGHGVFTINTSVASRFNTQGWNIDLNVSRLRFEINDYSTDRGNNRVGFFSTIIDWEIIS